MAGLNMAPYLGILSALAILDIILKGWALWRAARMNKSVWFIVLLLVNSVGILPGIFLLLTNAEYNKKAKPAPKKRVKRKRSSVRALSRELD